MNRRINELIPKEFPKSVIEQSIVASRIRTSNYMSRRLDLRSKTIFTFGETPDSAPEYAFSIVKKGNGWQLGVHVADVSEFVPEGSPIDLEAKNRLAAVENEFFFLKMLPEKLTELVALTVGKDKLALSALLDINPDGTVTSITCEESIIRVGTLCVYDEVNQLGLVSDASSVFALRDKYAPVVSQIEDFYTIAALCYGNRIANGGLDLTSFRTVYERNSDGKIVDICRKHDPDIRAVVREMNYFAAENLGKMIFEKKIPSIYLSQDAPSEEMLAFLESILKIEKTSDDASVRTHNIIENAKATSFYDFVCNSVISDMPPREFSDKPVLNAFTATDKVASCMHPITRYSDILTQRAFKTAISAKYDPKNINLKKQQNIMSESVEKANEAVKFMFDEEKCFKTLASLEYLENSGKDIFTGFPIMKTESGSVIIILEYGIEAQMPSEYAKNFDFDPAMPYLFKIVAIGTESEPTVVSLAE